MGRTIALVTAAILCGAIALAAADEYTFTYAGPTFSVGPADHVEVTFTTTQPLAPSTTYVTTTAAGVISGSLTVVASGGPVAGLTDLPFSTFMIETGSTASATATGAPTGITAWYIVGETSTVTGTSPSLIGEKHQAITGHTLVTTLEVDPYDFDNGTVITYLASCTGVPDCLTDNGQAYVPNYSGSIDPASSDAATAWQLTVVSTPVVACVDLPDGVINSAYSFTGLTVTGGMGSITWSATGLPDGLLIDVDSGEISGTPTTTGEYSPVVTVTDSNSKTGSVTLELEIEPALTLTGYLKNATVGVFYRCDELEADDGLRPYSWTATGLPPGITINPTTGFISGTTMTIASYTVTVTVTDATSTSVSKTVTMFVKTSLRLTGTLRNGTVGTAYRYTELRATGGVTPYAWAATDLPPGLTINPTNGTVGGVPTTAGIYPTIVSVTDAIGIVGTRASTIVITVLPLTLTGSLRSGTIGVRYTAGDGLRASGGIPPRTWSATGLPPGLSMDAATGNVTGTPTAGGTFTVVVMLTDSAPTPNTLTKTLSLPISMPALNINGVLASGTVNVAYSNGGITASGGAPPYTYSATGLPDGLTIDAASAVISGTPTAAGTYSVVVTVVDSAAQTKSKSANLVIGGGIALSGYLRNGTVGVAYRSEELRASSGTTPYSWSASGLPAGLAISLTSGSVTGTPTVGGTYTVVVTVTDAASRSVSRSFTVVIIIPVFALSGSLRSGQVAVPYNSSSYGPRASGGQPPYSFSATGLPEGLSISSTTGFITGTPIAAGTSSVMVTVVDSAATSVSKTYSLSISTTALSLTGNLANTGTVGTSYSTSLTATGGTPPYAWSATGLPAGVSIDASSGLVSGTPTIQGVFSTVVTVQDSLLIAKTKSGSVMVTSTAAPAFSCTRPSGATSAQGKSTVTAFDASTITVNGVLIQVPSCASIQWKGASGFYIGLMVEWGGYRTGTTTVASRISVSDSDSD